MESLARACSTPAVARLLSRVNCTSYNAVNGLFNDYSYWYNQTREYMLECESNFSTESIQVNLKVTTFKLDEYESKSACISTSVSVWKERYRYTTKQSYHICSGRQVDLDDMCYILLTGAHDSVRRQQIVLTEIFQTRRVTESVLMDAIRLVTPRIRLLCVLTKEVIECIDPDFILFIAYLACKGHTVSKQIAVNAICVRHEDTTRCIQYVEHASTKSLMARHMH